MVFILFGLRQAKMGKLHFLGIGKSQSKRIEKDGLYYDLVDVCQPDTCPVCHLLEIRERRYIDSLFYESVNDPGVREKLRRAGGLCDRHTALFLAIGDALGLSIIAKDLLSQWLNASGADFSRCPLCQTYEESEHRVIKAVSGYFYIDDFWSVLQNSAGLCRDHFVKISDELSSSDLKKRLEQFQTGKIRVLLQKLEQVIQKNDYRFQSEKIMEDEGKAIKIAWKLLKK